jgi:hypothetical protein
MNGRNLEHQLSGILRDVIQRTELPGSQGEPLPEGAFRWELPKDPSFGDLSSSVSF